MTDTPITATAALVAPVFEKFGKAEIYTHIAGATITAGQAVYINSSGDIALADCDVGAGSAEAQFRGVALNGGGTGQAIDVLYHGCVNGFDLSNLAYDDLVYLSATAGSLSETAPGTNDVIAGRVFPLSDTDTSGNPTKVLFIDVPMAHADWTG